VPCRVKCACHKRRRQASIGGAHLVGPASETIFPPAPRYWPVCRSAHGYLEIVDLTEQPAARLRLVPPRDALKIQRFTSQRPTFPQRFLGDCATPGPAFHPGENVRQHDPSLPAALGLLRARIALLTVRLIMYDGIPGRAGCQGWEPSRPRWEGKADRFVRPPLLSMFISPVYHHARLAVSSCLLSCR